MSARGDGWQAGGKFRPGKLYNSCRQDWLYSNAQVGELFVESLPSNFQLFILATAGCVHPWE